MSDRARIIEKGVVEAARKVLAEVIWAEERGRALDLPERICDALQTLRECCEDHSRVRVRR